ncbi:Tat pathway signal protein [Streptomyces sp. NBC_00503]|uniref:Tat pathway signal protein n=1 Tax=Streptomyces sp. NBC_00503 TaxID=2903659 RepID=UPI002E82433C|nr:Tat pathway signal protein [Streptomyces sp. NBC_00503]WUD85325.1 Tat pathway signal protein [Streptomyces sp. NBC_00503]
MQIKRNAAALMTATALLTGFGAVAGATSAQAAGGSYSATTTNGCGSASGTYHWYATGSASGKTVYRTDWNFNVYDNCADGKAVSLYVKYNKWDGSKWVYHTSSYNKLDSSGSSTNVADVRIFVCLVGDGNSCGEIH